MSDFIEIALISKILLRWYVKNGRVLPWRVSPKDSESGHTPDPYKVWISEIMLQQTTVKTVIPYFQKFIEKWGCIDKLSHANEGEVLAFWAGLGYYARGRNLLKCAKELRDKFNSKIPNDKKKLLSLPGIGEYTASAIRSIAFGEKEVVIDANIERVICRLFKIERPIKQSKKDIKECASQLFAKFHSGDLAQALMDFANSICKPKKPFCAQCPISRSCLSFKCAVVESIPAKPIKKNKPIKKGYVFFVSLKPNKFLLERRPSKGILGGLLGFPTTKWDLEKNEPTFPFQANWFYTGKVVTHQFSHFKLELEIVFGETEYSKFDNSKYFVAKRQNFDPSSLPTLMRKVYNKSNIL
ncbi:A/G-specific adenine glycosylase [Paracoccaceae bacterium]|nr:A/G-specific adenine glycosylase [Paracoccaceae bacterium]